MEKSGQFEFWSEEERDSFGPKKKTKMEILKEKRELQRQKLLERTVLSNEEAEKYKVPLKKEELINTIKNYNQICEDKFINSGRGLIDVISYHVSVFNPGIPQMLLTSLSQYSKKNKEELSVSDLAVMYKSLLNVLDDQSIKGNNFEKFRGANNMTFFGFKQFLIMEEFLKKVD